MNELANELDDFANVTASKHLRYELRALAHKLRYPMRDIIAKIPGEKVRDKAKLIRVAFQTMYTWQDERFRPVEKHATKIFKATGVPIEHIMEYPNDAGRTVAKTAAKLARGGEAASKLHGRAGRAKRRVVDAQARSGSVRTRRKRSGG